MKTDVPPFYPYMGEQIPHPCSSPSRTSKHALHGTHRSSLSCLSRTVTLIICYMLERRGLSSRDPTPITLHLSPYTYHPTPITLHLSPYTYHLHLSPYTYHPTPITLHLSPYTYHPTPITLHLSPYTYHFKGACYQMMKSHRRP